MNEEQTRTCFETLLLPLMKDAYNLSHWLMADDVGPIGALGE
jgi:hypothetical protein